MNEREICEDIIAQGECDPFSCSEDTCPLHKVSEWDCGEYLGQQGAHCVLAAQAWLDAHPKQYLEGVEVGDKLWDKLDQKWREVSRVQSDKTYPIGMKINYCTFGGLHDVENSTPRYLWDKVEEPKLPLKPKVKKSGWVNIEPGGYTIFVSEEVAQRNSSSHSIATIKVEWEE